MKRPKLLDSVALVKDLPEFRLRTGDSGVVVDVFESDAVSVELMDKEGDTVALVDLRVADLRALSTAELKHPQYPEPLPADADVVDADATSS